MTICIGIKVNECVVFVADSATTLASVDNNGAPVVTRVYNHADKVFNLYRGLPVTAMTCGLGNFGTESIATIAKSIRRQLMSGETHISAENYTIESIIRFAYDVFLDKFNALDAGIRQITTFEFHVGGFSHNHGGNEVWKFAFARGAVLEPACISGVDQCNIIWAGQPEACVRLVLGISSQTLAVLRDAGLDEAQASQLVQNLIAASEAPLLEPSMPVIDAIRLGEFLAQTTASFVRFLPGADTVGGDLDIATVTKYEGFRWIRRKHFYPQAINGEPDHVS
ncbi:hypothetical protein GFM14_02875 [Rhizobium leguminosarum bv. viciae]|uniref:hypothetical protein n=1 Tax=Rhizobium TaxID=379 RepID=UPI0010309455|nr:hypothetical protein [Rhizobium leguminosarum]NKJ90561.1 hypothetical protein [Rhizobium leguminosarum bv. viciae]TBG68068.1 hypothetical protein ELG74_09495 [Rhizobium leguminosarum]